MQDVEHAPLPLYLRIEDRNSMAHSVETRLPFLDYRLVSLAFDMTADWKLRGPWNKFVLREAMRQRIPESVRTRLDKMGFPVPDKKWFAQDLYEPMQDLLTSQVVRERGIYNVSAIAHDLQRHRDGQADVTRRLFYVAQFETLANLLKADPVQQPPRR
jgi:asparagine synthase (glutamine-hydrolysing)